MFKKCILICLAASPLLAKDFGSRGENFAVAEEDMTHYLQQKLQESMKGRSVEEEIINYCLNPDPIPGIGKSIEMRSFNVDFSQTLTEDVTVGDKVLFQKGETLNPLDEIDLPGGMLFLDGTDPAELAWARKKPDNFMWILVKGSPIRLQEQEDRDIYFDQAGFLTLQLKVQNTPALAKQSGSKMFVEEVLINEKGEEIR